LIAFSHENATGEQISSRSLLIRNRQNGILPCVVLLTKREAKLGASFALGSRTRGDLSMGDARDNAKKKKAAEKKTAKGKPEIKAAPAAGKPEGKPGKK
jgi:hypothetical protein